MLYLFTAGNEAKRPTLDTFKLSETIKSQKFYYGYCLAAQVTGRVN